MARVNPSSLCRRCAVPSISRPRPICGRRSLAYAVQFRDVIDRYGWQLVGETRYAVELVDDLNRDELPAFLEPLTERERVVLEYLPSMMSNAEIAQQMLISVNTVKTHLKAVYRKLGVERRRDAVVRARQLEML